MKNDIKINPIFNNTSSVKTSFNKISKQNNCENSNTLQYGQDKLAFLGKTQIVFKGRNEETSSYGVQVLKDGTLRKNIFVKNENMVISKDYKDGKIVSITTSFKNPDPNSPNFSEIAFELNTVFGEQRKIDSFVCTETTDGDISIVIKYEDGTSSTYKHENGPFSTMDLAFKNESILNMSGICNFMAYENFRTTENSIEDEVAKHISKTATEEGNSIEDEVAKHISKTATEENHPIFPCLYTDDSGIKVAYESGTTMVDVYGNVYVLVLINNSPEQVKVNEIVDKQLISKLMNEVRLSFQEENEFEELILSEDSFEDEYENEFNNNETIDIDV